MKFYRDIETGKTVTTEDLRKEFAERIVSGNPEFDGMTFAEYLENSMTRNNGTLEEAEVKTYRIRVTQTMHVTFEVNVEAHTEEEAIERFDIANGDGEYWEEWDDAYAYADREDATVYVEEVRIKGEQL